MTDIANRSGVGFSKETEGASEIGRKVGEIAAIETPKENGLWRETSSIILLLFHHVF